MSKITGAVEAVSSQEKRAKGGIMYRIGIKVGGEWYNQFKKTKPTVQKGDEVTFTWKQTEYGKDIDGDLLVTEAGESSTGDGRPASSAKAPAGRGNSFDSGIKVGHALNNAVALVVAGTVKPAKGKTTIETIENVAWQIIKLSQKMVIEFPVRTLPAKEVVAEEAEQEAEPAPAPKPAAAAKKGPEPDGFDEDLPFS